MNDLIGHHINNYRIEALLGSGGMGTVYRAYDLNLAIPVALKVMHAQLSRQKEFQQRFLQEARAAARLNEHPSIVTIHHFGGSQGMLFMVMALVTGGSLSAHIQYMQRTGQAVQLKETLTLLAQVADALGFAHRKGVIHRDIKPGNVLVQRLEKPEREGDPPLRAVVTDFGLAKLVEGGLDTRTGDLLGTYGYMSPEQCLQKHLDGRSDIYSLGVMLYQLTTGSLPFDIRSPTDAVIKHLNEHPIPPSALCPGLPPRIDVMIRMAISKKPEDRFQEAEAFAKELRETARGLTDADITKFTGQRQTLSLVTHLEPALRVQEPSRMGFGISPYPSTDQLLIASKDHTPRPVALDKSQLTIGRSPENDIVLDHPDVSRQHALLETSSTGWQIVDLKSTNGTHLDGIPLLAGVKETFSPGKTLRIGPFFIHLRKSFRAGVQSGALDLSDSALRSVPADATHMQSLSGQIGVTIRPDTVEVMPGDCTEVQVELFNQGVLVDHFKISILGLQPSWIKVPQPIVELMPGVSQALVFQILPPKDSSSKAGSYPYKVRIQSEASPTETATIPGELVVKPFENYSVEMNPTRLANNESSRISIRNEGNDVGTFSLTGRDPANEILFTGEEARIRILPGGVAVRSISARVKKRPLIGTTSTLPFEVLVKTRTNTQKGSLGQLHVKPVLPAWLLPLAAIFLVMCMVIGGFGLNAWNRNTALATQTAGAKTAIVFSVVNTQSSQLTQQNQETQRAGQVTVQAAAVEATSAALTAVALGDDDRDGLSNQKELELGTDPGNPDTDKDGLTDGQEVNEYGTDPKKKDTDNDNLSDGDEVNRYQTIPTNPDTDGDGVLDGVEVSTGGNPIVPSSATMPPTDTPSPTATPTPTPIATPTASITPTPSKTITPISPSTVMDGVPEYGIQPITVVYDLVANANKSHWTSGAGELSWSGTGVEERGSARWVYDSVLEDGSTVSQALETHPEWINGGWISGAFTDIYWTGYVVKTGDRLSGMVGFMQGAGAGKVKFQVMIRPEGGPNTWIAEISDSYDGQLKDLDLSLDAWAGKAADFILKVDADGIPSQDWAVWVDVRIER
jgi:eukaryotic-like serine/threonine-protein kinase